LKHRVAAEKETNYFLFLASHREIKALSFIFIDQAITTMLLALVKNFLATWLQIFSATLFIVHKPLLTIEFFFIPFNFLWLACHLASVR
jgi:hypothetical protein